MNTFRRIPRFRLLVPLVAILLSPALAQADEAGKNETASFRFVRFAELPPVGAMNSDGKFAALEVYPNFIGRPVRLKVENSIPLLAVDEKGAPLQNDGKIADSVLTFSPLHDTPRQLVLIYTDGKKTVARNLPDSPAKFPFGRVLAVNETDTALIMDVGGVSGKLPPKEATLCGASSKVAGMADLAVRITTDDDKRPKLLYSTVWPVNAKVRTLAFIQKNESGRFLVRTVTDTSVPEPVETAPAVEQPAPAVTPESVATPGAAGPPEAKPVEKIPDAAVPVKS